VVPPKQQQEWTELVSTKTGEPIATVSADDPAGFALGLADKILGPLGAQWFYEGESLGYRTLYVWIEDQDLMITVQANSPLGDAVSALYDVVRKSKAD
jgi:D-alanyl-D-alanine carboxypeptidase